MPWAERKSPATKATLMNYRFKTTPCFPVMALLVRATCHRTVLLQVARTSRAMTMREPPNRLAYS